MIRYSLAVFFGICILVMGHSVGAFAEMTASVSIPEGTSVPGCEEIENCYIPYKTTIDVGGVVTWSNDDSVAHTVTSGKAEDGASGEFDSGYFMAGTTYAHEFLKTGEYPYHCIVHPWMEGVVIVNDSSQVPLSIDSHTNKNFYEYGDSVGVSGKIKNYDADLHSDLKVTYHVLNPNGGLVKMGETTPGSFGAFSFNFVAKGEKFESSGDYSIQMAFGAAESELPMYFTGGEPEVEDVTPPLILQPKDIEVTTEGNDEVVMVTFEVFATDDIDELVQPTCKPSSGFLFGIGETIVKCTAKDSAGNFATPVSFSVIVKPPVISIPSWVKNVAGFWCQDKIDDASFVEGIQYLIDNNIIVIPATSEKFNETQEVPQWVKNNACWWSEGSITDLDFSSGIEYLVREGIIVV